jgi:chromosome segregation ATPase
MHAFVCRAVFVCVFASLPLVASAQAGDRNAERAARRAQLQTQALQQQLQDAQAAKTKLETDKAQADQALATQTQQAGRMRGQVQKLGADLKASEAARAELAATVQALEKQLAELKRNSDEALAVKARETAQMTRQRDEQLAVLQRKHDDQVALVGDCASKNTRLIKLSAELANRWRDKSVVDVVKQRDVVLGLTDVQMFNLVQDYRDKAEAERFLAPATHR